VVTVVYPAMCAIRCISPLLQRSEVSAAVRSTLAAGLRRDLPAGYGVFRAVVRGTHAAATVPGAISGLSQRRSGMVAAAHPLTAASGRNERPKRPTHGKPHS